MKSLSNAPLLGGFFGTIQQSLLVGTLSRVRCSQERSKLNRLGIRLPARKVPIEARRIDSADLNRNRVLAGYLHLNAANHVRRRDLRLCVE